MVMHMIFRNIRYLLNWRLSKPVSKPEYTNSLKMYIELELYDKNGKLIERRTEPAHSWVRNIATALNSFLNGGNIVFSGDNTEGETYVYNVDDKPERYMSAPAGEDKRGILVGSSDATFSRLHWNLASKIPHGTASGQLSYEACTVTYTDPNIKIERRFTNNTSANITVKEIGLFIAIKPSAFPIFRYYMLARDVISPVTIPQDASLKVTYNISTS